MDGVYCTAATKRSLVQFISGAGDGEVRVWDLDHRTCVWRAFAHSGFVRGLTVVPDGETFFSCGDNTIKQWELGVAEDLSQVNNLIILAQGVLRLQHACTKRKNASKHATLIFSHVVAMWF